MALSNPDSVVTEQRLSEFYQGIYPYLGGGSSVANYSTNEQTIGTWIDGKPLYQITYNITFTDNNTSGTAHNKVLVAANDLPANISESIIQSGYLQYDTVKLPLTFSISSSYLITKINPTNGIHYESSGWNWIASGDYGTKKAVITIQYTKTTD